MQQFLLNEKVITELHMQPVKLKQRTKFAKKYDLPSKTSSSPIQSKEIHNLLQLQRKTLSKPRADQNTHFHQASPKTKHLLSTLNFLKSNRTQTQSSSRNVLKQNYFTVRGITKQSMKSKQMKKSISRTCSLVSVMKTQQNNVPPYDFNTDLRFKRSPKCFFSPKTKQNNNKNNNSPKDKQHLIFKQYSNTGLQSKKPISITEMVDKQIQELIKKRKANNRTAPQKYSSKTKNHQRYSSMDFEEDICKMQAKIYNEMRENKEKLIRRNKERVGINIEKNQPFGETQINKNAGKLLKKYHCGQMAYFQKFFPKD